MDLSKPLAYRMMPKTLDDYVGQEHILGENKILYRTIKADRLSSIILWGPPGCGKTSLAKVISNTTKYKFIKLNAVTAGVSDIKNAIIESENLLMNPSGKCILFIDEIHRFNKLQQDALLPYVENGTVILIGATIELAKPVIGIREPAPANLPILLNTFIALKNIAIPIKLIDTMVEHDV